MGPEQARFERRRGIIVVQVAVAITVILGFAALGVDVGLMYAAKADLQKVADAAALAAVSQLSNHAEAEARETTVAELARQAALDILAHNGVLGVDIVLEEEDILYGTSVWNQSEGKFEFVEGGQQNDGFNAVRIIARRTDSSSNGAVDLTFGGVLGFSEADIEAAATAILVPRDIVIVADLSGSYNDDSQLQNYADNDPQGINLYEVWQTLPRSSVDGELLAAWLQANPDLSVADAPSHIFRGDYGFFSQLGAVAEGVVPVFGQVQINSSYDPLVDSGLIGLGYRQAWANPELGPENHTKLRDFLAGIGYSDYETRCIMADTWSSTTNTDIRGFDSSAASYPSEYSSRRTYDLRVAVALGLVYWNSGMAGGLWETKGWEPGSGGWGINTSEVVERVPYPFPSGNWFEYAAYMRDASNSNWAADVLPGVKYQFGAKTFTNFLLEEKEQFNETDVTHYAYANPLHLTKNSLDVLMDDIAGLDSDDRVSLVTYGTTAVMEYQLPDDDVNLDENAKDIKALYRGRQAAHYTPATNIGQGIEAASHELDYSNPESLARPEATKVIVLLTDGMANIDLNGDYDGSGAAGIAYAVEAAGAAWENHRIRIHAVGVGSKADMTTLDSIADIGQTGTAFQADGTFEEIQAELTEIFHKIGGMRPVQIID